MTHKILFYWNRFIIYKFLIESWFINLEMISKHSNIDSTESILNINLHERTTCSYIVLRLTYAKKYSFLKTDKTLSWLWLTLLESKFLTNRRAELGKSWSELDGRSVQQDTKQDSIVIKRSTPRLEESSKWFFILDHSFRGKS